MATTLRINRRVTGAAGAPSSLKSAELAYNMVDGILYAGYGDDGTGTATSIRGFAKDDYDPKHRLPVNGTSGQVLTVDGSGNAIWGPAPQTGTNYTAGSGITITSGTIAADTAVVATVTSVGLKADKASPTFTGTPAAPTATAGTNTTQLATTAFVSTAVSPKANSASPAFTGTPTAPTATSATNNTQLATTAFVSTAISNLIGGAGAAYDTLSELQTLIQNDMSGLSALTTTVDGKLTKASNLSDLTDFAAARTNLGLGTMAVQNASAVAITGGSINGVILDGGTF
ncbi:hypothetical protein C8J42_102502 [Sphingomonas sp. PP-CE-1A-559]|nr:hypothetical protein C8J42_102502 [Sphingomonas sp. PP-CE-1A-559]